MRWPSILGPGVVPAGRNLIIRTALVAVGTLWWYLLAASSMLQAGFLGVSRATAIAVAGYTVISQVVVVLVLLRIGSAQSLRAVQAWTMACIMLCVPADSAVILAKPLGHASSVLAFYWVTFVYGLFIVHYTRVADAREHGVTPLSPDKLPRSSYTQRMPAQPTVVSTLQAYRPPADLSAVLMAFVFSKHFVVFTCAVAGVHTILVEGGGGTGTDPTHLAALIVGFGLAVAAAGLDMTFTLVFPGIELSEHLWLAVCQSILDLVVVVSAIALGHLEACEGQTTADRLVNAAMFGAGTMNLGGRLRRLHTFVGRHDMRLDEVFYLDVALDAGCAHRAESHLL